MAKNGKKTILFLAIGVIAVCAIASAFMLGRGAQNSPAPQGRGQSSVVATPTPVETEGTKTDDELEQMLKSKLESEGLTIPTIGLVQNRGWESIPYIGQSDQAKQAAYEWAKRKWSRDASSRIFYVATEGGVPKSSADDDYFLINVYKDGDSYTIDQIYFNLRLK